MKTTAKLKYLLWAARLWPVADRACPGCQSSDTQLIKRKYGVTGLYRCTACALMFRVPKGSLDDDGQFYEADYTQESTTDLPDDDQLEALQRSSFRDIGKDYSGYITVLRAAGLEPPSSIYDFGSSWGYGSWQFRHSGYKVYSYEVARTRAKFAEEKLGCYTLTSPNDVPHKVDCLFASHVIEHLADPNLLWQTAVDVLKPEGVVVLFMPNGEPSRARVATRTYHQLWGRVHPLLLTAAALIHMARRFGYAGVAYSSPYEIERIAQGAPGELEGEELLFVARRMAV